jgi:hypothetical protein
MRQIVIQNALELGLSLTALHVQVIEPEPAETAVGVSSRLGGVVLWHGAATTRLLSLPSRVTSRLLGSTVAWSLSLRLLQLRHPPPLLAPLLPALPSPLRCCLRLRRLRLPARVRGAVSDSERSRDRVTHITSQSQRPTCRSHPSPHVTQSQSEVGCSSRSVQGRHQRPLCKHRQRA